MKDGIELEVVDNPLTFYAHYKPTALRGLYVVYLEQVAQENTVVVLTDVAEIAQREHAPGQLRRRHLTS